MSDAITYYKQYLDKNGYTMDRFKNTSRVASLKSLITRYTPQGGVILDVGCGDMHLAKSMPGYAWQGLDINVEQSGGLGKEHNLESFPYPFSEHSFDTIVCSEVLEHMFNPAAITKEIRRLIKPGGTYILSTPNFSNLDHYLQSFAQIEADLNKPWTYEHIRQYTLQSHQQILATANFEVVNFTGADAHYSPFFGQGRETLRNYLENLGEKDPDFVKTDQLIGAMFPLHNHTLIIVARPI